MYSGLDAAIWKDYYRFSPNIWYYQNIDSNSLDGILCFLQTDLAFYQNGWGKVFDPSFRVGLQLKFK